jgi:hypothetical protein
MLPQPTRRLPIPHPWLAVQQQRQLGALHDPVR